MASRAASTNLPAHHVAETEVSREHRLLLHAAIFLVAFFAVFLRRPDALLNAQFYAEDGMFFYADAYHFGWRCLFMPYGGYLHTPLRLVGLFSQLFSFGSAPLVMNLCAIVVQILPVNLFLSDRFQAIPFHQRLLGCLFYLAIPNSMEIHANTSNIQWHLALLAFLLLAAKPAANSVLKACDLLVLALFALGSPLCFALIPIAVALRWRRKDPGQNMYLAALIPGTLLQALVVLLSNSRFPVQNGATAVRFTGILGGQIFLSALLGVRSFAQLYLLNDGRLLLGVEVAALVLGLSIGLYSFRHAPFELRLFFLFAAVVLVLGLSRPIAGPDRSFPQWEYLQIPGRSSRYYFFPILAYYAALISLATNMTSANFKPARYLAMALLLLSTVGIYRDWRYPKFADLHFQTYAAVFERSAPGVRVTIPINPVGWEMQLVKH